MSIRDEIEEIKDKTRVYLRAGRYDAAERLLRATLAEYGPLANVHNLLGVALQRQSRFGEAIDSFKKAIKANPDFLEASLNLSAALCDIGSYDEGKRVYDKATAKKGLEKAPRVLMGRIADRHAQLGHMYFESGMESEAIEEFKKALALFKRMPDVELALTRALINKLNFKEAEQHAERILGYAPSNADARVLLGIIHYKNNRSVEARRQWELAFKLEPNNASVRAYFQLSRAWPDVAESQTRDPEPATGLFSPI